MFWVNNSFSANTQKCTPLTNEKYRKLAKATKTNFIFIFPHNDKTYTWQVHRF